MKFKIVFLVCFLSLTNIAFSLENQIKASGIANVKIAQTIATINIGLQLEGDDATKLQNQLKQKAAKLLAELKTCNTLEISTTQISLNPKYSYANKTQTVVGYNAVYTYQIKALIPNLGQIIQVASDNGANNISNPKFKASEKLLVEARLKAIKTAAIQAQTYASSALSALGLKAKIIKTINVEVITQQPEPRYMLMNTVAKSDSLPVEAGEDNVQAKVDLVINY